MKNIFENAMFGDKFQTRNGRIAIYWNHNHNKHELIFAEGTWTSYKDDGSYTDYEHELDIISKLIDNAINANR